MDVRQERAPHGQQMPRHPVRLRQLRALAARASCAVPLRAAAVISPRGLDRGSGALRGVGLAGVAGEPLQRFRAHRARRREQEALPEAHIVIEKIDHGRIRPRSARR